MANMPLIATSGAGLAVAIEHACGAGLVWNPWQGLWRLAVVLLLLLAARAFGRALADRFDGIAFTSWWDPAREPDGTLGWDELLSLVRPGKDPIENVGRSRPGVMVRCFAVVGVVAVVGTSCTG